MMIFVFFLMRKLRILSKTSLESFFEVWVAQCSFPSVFSQKVLACILIFITNCIRNQFIERFRTCALSTVICEVTNFSNLIFVFSFFLIISTTITDSKRQSTAEDSKSLAVFDSWVHFFCKSFSVIVESLLLIN